MKVSRLAKEIGIVPSTLYRELVQRGLQIKSMEHPLDSASVDALRDQFKQDGRVHFDSLFGEVRDEFKKDAKTKEWDRYAGDGSKGSAFERDVGLLIQQFYPNSHLTGLFLFIAEQLTTTDRFGRELDHLIHVRRGDAHWLYIIECKASELELRGKASMPLQHKKWIVQTRKGAKDVKEQMRLQTRSLLQLLKPLPEMNLNIQGIVVLPDTKTEDLIDDREQDEFSVSYRSLSFGAFEAFLQDLDSDGEVMRVGQSELLRRLRQGMRCPVLGHPDIRDAIDYHQRARLTLDFGLFQDFSPSKDKWAINGTAGMGKSVLLAYTLCVLCCDFQLRMGEDGKLALEPFDAAAKGWPKLEDRKIVVFSLKEKQRKIVVHFWKRLMDVFQQHDIQNQLRIQRPEIRLLERGQDFDENVVLIDEAHDLSLPAQEKLASWKDAKPAERYLVIACDRHQKLRLLDSQSSSQRMVAGLDFSRQTRKLKRVYRNPFSVYGTGLALMFRWFSPNGPKVVPNETQLEHEFGFEVIRRDVEAGLGCQFEMVEDAHPANNWHHCVSDFPDASTAHSWLGQYNLKSEDVLWVRFSKEDSDFDYEQLHRYQYHNLHSEESASLIDKYIKGQEFPVVVIEGVGSHFNDMEDQEAMFLHRREIYLCASRATVFLFFIHNPEVMDDAAQLVQSELKELQRNLSRPVRESATQFWGLQFQAPDGTIPLTQFEDMVDPLEALKGSEDENGETAGVSIEVEAVDSEEDVPVKEKQQEAAVNEDQPVEQNVVTAEALEVKPVSFSHRIKQAFGDYVYEPDLQGALHELPYTPIDFYTPAILAHYLKIDLPELEEILVEYDMEPSDTGRISYTTVQKVCQALDVPEPWNNSDLSQKPNRVFVQYKGEPLTRSNVAKVLCDEFKVDGLSPAKAKSVIDEVLGDPNQSSKDGASMVRSSQSISLIQFAQIVNQLSLDGDRCLALVRPLHQKESSQGSEDTKKDVTKLPLNRDGYTVLDTYTPKKLAEYFDIKPYKVMAEIMTTPGVMNLSVNEKIELSLVEKICRKFKQPSPWEHSSLGNSLPHVSVGGRPLKAKRLPDLILNSYRGQHKVRLKKLKATLERLDVSNAAKDVVLSGTQLYELLKQLDLKPETMLESVRVYHPQNLK